MSSDLQKEYQVLKDQFAKEELKEEIVVSEGESFVSAVYKDVMITHIPTGIEVISDQYDSQLRNAIAALKELIAKLNG